MLALFKNTLFLTFILTSLSQCQNQKTYSSKTFKKIEQNIKNQPIAKRISQWKKLSQSDSLTTLQKAYIYFDLANDLQNTNQEKMSISYYQKALEIFESENKDEMTAKTLVNLGISHAFLNHKNIASKMIIKGLEIADRLNNNYIKSRAYGELAHLYYLNNDKKKAIDYLKKAGDMYLQMKDTSALSAVYNNIGIIYKEQNQPEKAYEYTLKSFYLKDSLEDPFSLIESYNNLGALSLLYKKQPDTARYYYNKALQLAKRNQLKPISVYENLADLYHETGQQDSANYYLDKALASNPDNYKEKMHLYDLKLRYLLQEKKDTEALHILQIKDSLSKLNETEFNKEMEKSIENKLRLLAKEKQLDQVRIINKKNQIIFMFIAIIFLLGLLISYQLNRLDRLNFKQEQFKLEQKVLRSQMNPHFIFNVLSSIQSSLIDNNPILSATYLSKFAQLIRQNFEFIQKKSIPLASELQMLRNYMDTQKFRYKDKFDYQIKVDKNIDQNECRVPPMILQPFIENAIEHGFKNINHKGTLCIKVIKKENYLCFDIIDNGQGYHPKKDHKEHALDVFKKRLLMIGKDAFDSFSIENLKQGTKVYFCIPDDFDEN